MDFASLKSRILAVLGRAPNAVVYEMVTSEINQRLRLRDMEATATLTVAASISMATESITDFLEVESIYLDGSYPKLLQPTSPQLVKAEYVASKVPTRFAIVDGAILLDGAGGSDDIELRYFARQDDLSADGDTNDILTYYPNIYVYGSLYHHSRLIRDYEAAGGFGQDYEAAMRMAISTDAQARMGGDPVTPYVRTAP